MSRDLDSIVKGAATVPSDPNKSNTTPIATPSGRAGDPTNNAPNTPSMVYLNLLILEASLRAQFLELRARRRHHTFFMTLLTAWIALFGWLVFLAPREDGLGMGGSIYWAVEGAQKVCLMGGVITAVLIWAVGIWERGIRWPRRWFAISNRGLRPFNCKLVLARRPWYAEAVSTIAFFLTYGLFSHTSSSSYRYVDAGLLREVQRELNLSGDAHPTLIAPPPPSSSSASRVATSTGPGGEDDMLGHEEDLAPGGDYVKLLLLAKPFSPTFRENWELYRTEYWERENERRALLRAKVKEHDRALAKQRYGWLWWLPGRRVVTRPSPSSSSSSGNNAKMNNTSGISNNNLLHPNARHHGHNHHPADRKRRSSSSNTSARARRGSTSSSRSAASTAAGTGAAAAGLDSSDDGKPSRRLSASSSASSSTAGPVGRTRKQASVSSRPKKPVGAAGAASAVSAADSRSVTPDIPSPLAMERSISSESHGSEPNSSRRLTRSASRSKGVSP
ncbi:Spo7-like protein [Geosmithia morbida]|uniref:Spo7-like protein n=1 Tax=Geosmithia morbida TaxID=1094350 RepID=A0A9P4Z3A6_9HYPO|nr:Spo7-like protein [Geosmithia morbida]KAF4126667.1 Spo7-like protein [Geosmithia morbida]